MMQPAKRPQYLAEHWFKCGGRTERKDRKKETDKWMYSEAHLEGIREE